MTKDMHEPEEEEIIEDGHTGVDIEDSSSDEEINDPFDPTKIRMNTNLMTIGLLCTRMKYNEINLSPDFKRKAGIWKEDAQSRLIESILIRIPLPGFYIDATNEARWIVIDGSQRLAAIKKFVLDKQLRLCNLDFLRQFEGKSFDDLPRNYQRRIEEAQITVFLIEKGTPDEVKFNIFKRINTSSGLALSAQEIRHALNQGFATQFLAQLANSEEFKRATDYSIRDDRMADHECVLRFLAFTLMLYTKYDKTIESFDDFLNKTMKDLNKMAPQTSDDLQRQFKRAMNAAYELFDKDAFRKRIKGNDPRQPINKALFESWSVNLSQLTDSQLALLIQRRDIVRQKFIALMNIDRAFNEAISQGTGDQKKVKYRFKAIENMIMGVLSE